MKRRSFLTLAASFVAATIGDRRVLAAARVRTVARLGRADRATLVGGAGACASRRRTARFAGYTHADFV